MNVPIRTGAIHTQPRIILPDAFKVLSEPSPLDPIVAAVCKHFAVPLSLLLSARRAHWITWPRHIAMLLAYELTPLSYNEIGRFFGRTHKAVLEAAKSVRDRCEIYQADKDTVQKIREAIA